MAPRPDPPLWAVVIRGGAALARLPLRLVEGSFWWASMIDVFTVVGVLTAVARLPGLRGWALHGSSGRLFLLGLAVWFLYYVGGIGVFGRTLGGLVVQLRTVSLPDGARPGFRAAVIRWVLAVVSLPALLLARFVGFGMYWALYDKRLRLSQTLDIREDDRRELMALHVPERRELLRTLQENSALLRG
jgi:hypothetical protein